jgi:hypothetical protein
LGTKGFAHGAPLKKAMVFDLSKKEVERWVSIR